MKPAAPASGSNMIIHTVGGVVCAVIVSAAIYAFVTPIVRARHESNLQLARLSTVSEELAQVVSVNRGLESQRDRLAASVQARAMTLIPAQDLNRRLADLTNLCLENGLSPEVIQPRESRRGSVTVIQPIRFEVSGPVDSIYELLGRFDRDHPDLHADALTIEHTSPGTVRMRTVLSWFTAPAP